MKPDIVACAFAFVSNFLQYVCARNWQNWMPSVSAITPIKRWRFLWDTEKMSLGAIWVSLPNQSVNQLIQKK